MSSENWLELLISLHVFTNDIRIWYKSYVYVRTNVKDNLTDTDIQATPKYFRNVFFFFLRNITNWYYPIELYDRYYPILSIPKKTFKFSSFWYWTLAHYLLFCIEDPPFRWQSDKIYLSLNVLFPVIFVYRFAFINIRRAFILLTNKLQTKQAARTAVRVNDNDIQLTNTTKILTSSHEQIKYRHGSEPVPLPIVI